MDGQKRSTRLASKLEQQKKQRPMPGIPPTMTGRLSTGSTSNASPANNNNANNIRNMFDKLEKSIQANFEAFKTSILTDLNAFKQSVQDSIKEVKKDVEDLKAAANFVSNQVDDIENKLEETRMQVNAQADQVSHLVYAGNALNNAVTNLEGQLNRIEQEKLKNNIVISGVGKIEQPEEIFKRIIHKLEANILDEEILAVEVLNKKKSDNTQKRGFANYTLLIKLNTAKAKEELLKKKKAAGKLFTSQLMNAESEVQNRSGHHRDKELFVRDHLTRYTQRLFEEAKQLQVAKVIKYLWTKNGRILASNGLQQRTVEIMSLDDINRLRSTNDAKSK